MKKQNGSVKGSPQKVITGMQHGNGSKGRSTDTMLIARDIILYEGGESR
jgi:hypothetical protein